MYKMILYAYLMRRHSESEHKMTATLVNITPEEATGCTDEALYVEFDQTASHPAPKTPCPGQTDTAKNMLMQLSRLLKQAVTR